MPITYTIDPERKLILTKVSCDLTISKTIEYFKRLQHDNNCPDSAIEVVDFSGVTDFAIQYGDMNAITTSYQTAKNTKDIQATIFNCSSDLSYGIARMLQTIHEITNKEHKVIITRHQEDLTKCIERLQSERNSHIHRVTSASHHEPTN